MAHKRVSLESLLTKIMAKDNDWESINAFVDAVVRDPDA
jgi:hypothetical protein